MYVVSFNKFKFSIFSVLRAPVVFNSVRCVCLLLLIIGRVCFHLCQITSLVEVDDIPLCALSVNWGILFWLQSYKLLRLNPEKYVNNLKTCPYLTIYQTCYFSSSVSPVLNFHWIIPSSYVLMYIIDMYMLDGFSTLIIRLSFFNYQNERASKDQND